MLNIKTIYLPTKTLHPNKLFNSLDEVKMFLRDHVTTPYTLVNSDNIWQPLANQNQSTINNLRVLLHKNNDTAFPNGVNHRKVLIEHLKALHTIDKTRQLLKDQIFRDQFTVALDDFITKYNPDSPEDVKLRDACVSVLGKIGNHLLEVYKGMPDIQDELSQVTSWIIDLNALCDGKNATLSGFLNKVTNILTDKVR